VLLVYPPGLDFVTAFFGCLYAGCAAVPTYPPHRHRMLERFQAVAADAGVRIALSNASGAAQFQAMMEVEKNGQADTSSRLSWLATDEIPMPWRALAGTGHRSRHAGHAPIHLRLDQPAQGHHGQSRESHGQHPRHPSGFRRTARDSSGSGCPCTMTWGWWAAFWSRCSPGDKRFPLAGHVPPEPHHLAGRHQQVSGYHLRRTQLRLRSCIRKITDEQRATLDLSSWALAFVGAEPIEPGTLERFAAAFAPCGFNPRLLSVLRFGGGDAHRQRLQARQRRGPRAFHGPALTRNRVEPVPTMPAGPPPGACGSPVGDLRVVIVDPHNRAEAASGRVGEIWVAGTSVGQGYWHKPGQTRRSFDARLSDTGAGPVPADRRLGFMREGQLYVTGRLDDLIIIRGLNRYPQISRPPPAAATRCWNPATVPLSSRTITAASAWFWCRSGS